MLVRAMFFIYMGGGPAGMAASIGLLLFSIAMNTGSLGVIQDALGFGSSAGSNGAGPGWEPRRSSRQGQQGQQEEDYPRGGNRQRGQSKWSGGEPGPRQLAAMSSTQLQAVFTAISLVSVVCFGCGYALREYPDNPWVRRLRMTLLSVQDAAQRWLGRQFVWQVPAGAGAGAAPGREVRQRASAAHVAALPTERFASRKKLLQWGGSGLKEELRRLHAIAASRGGYDGGAEARETEALVSTQSNPHRSLTPDGI